MGCQLGPHLLPCPDPGSLAPGAHPTAPHRDGVPISARLSASPPTALVPPFLTCQAAQDSHAHPGPRARAGVFPPRPGTGFLQPKLPGARPRHSRALPATGGDEGASPGPTGQADLKTAEEVTEEGDGEAGGGTKVNGGYGPQFPDGGSLPSPSQEPGLTVEADGEAAGLAWAGGPWWGPSTAHLRPQSNCSTSRSRVIHREPRGLGRWGRPSSFHRRGNEAHREEGGG